MTKFEAPFPKTFKAQDAVLRLEAGPIHFSIDGQVFILSKSPYASKREAAFDIRTAEWYILRLAKVANKYICMAHGGIAADNDVVHTTENGYIVIMNDAHTSCRAESYELLRVWELHLTDEELYPDEGDNE